jgi:hypothetical protein
MNAPTYTAFAGFRRLASGGLREVLPAVKDFSADSPDTVLIFDHSNGRQVDFDLRGSLEEVFARLEPREAPRAPAENAEAAKPGKGRPRLGVVAGEVTLLPRHWEWLAAQPLKASGTLRRLVDEARAKEAADPKRRREALGAILWSLAGNLPGFEEASRALYAGDAERFLVLAEAWPRDVADFAKEWTAAMG